MAACPPPLFPHLHLRAVYSTSSRTSARPCDHIQLLCQSSPSRSFVFASAKSNICLHEGSPVEISVSELSIPDFKAPESSISADIRAREPSIAATGSLDEASASAGYEGGEPSAECRVELAGNRSGESCISDEACTSCSFTETDVNSLAGARLLGEPFHLDELCSTRLSLPKEDASSLLASSDAAVSSQRLSSVSSSQSLSSVSAASLQTADSISKANASSLLASSDVAESSQSLSSMPATSPQTRDRSKVVRTAWKALVRWSRFWQLLNAGKATNVLQKTKKVVVIGGGSFGTAMAVLLARNKSEMQVSLLLRDSSLCESINKDHVNRKYFPKHILPHNIVATVNPQEAFKDSEYCIHAVPVQYSAEFLKSISEHVPPSLPFFSVSKGLELSSLEMMSQVIPRALGNPRQSVAVISGPSFSIELMDELPTAMVVASKDKELARAAQQLLASRYLRINTSSDVVGVEIAGALKNVLAIAAGIVEGMNLGNNCMAALVAQGCSEIRWLAEKMGAKSTTLAGLSGAGDIMLTCFVNLSRNRSLGVRLGSGESLSDILSSMNQVAEGVATAGAVIALARKYRVQMPVLTAVARILDNELTPKRAVLELMSLPQVEEV